LWSSLTKYAGSPALWTLEFAQFIMVGYYLLGGYELIAILMFSSMMALLLTGQRVFGAIGFVAVVAALLLWGDRRRFRPRLSAVIKLMKWYPLLTLPMFIFMGYVLSESKIADDLYKMFHVWMGRSAAALRSARSV
jgi:TRAP-type mannitol/chloroaromatic compound transport system permease large subunit